VRAPDEREARVTKGGIRPISIFSRDKENAHLGESDIKVRPEFYRFVCASFKATSSSRSVARETALENLN